jgi:hypothetical protein
MSDSTSILDLPTDPSCGSSDQYKNNINLNITEKQPFNENMNGLDQSTINQLMSGLQQANNTGSTQLPSRDIPQNTEIFTQDEQIKPNYIPQEKNHQDYIKKYDENNPIIQNVKNDSLDDMYNELQIPILLAVLYFLFQLPIFKIYLFRYLPILFLKDGNLNINGYLFTSIIFSLLYYLLSKTTLYFTNK